MKAIFTTFNEAHYDAILALLEKTNIKGFTNWAQVRGRGSVNGEPHYGSHAWPTMNSSILIFAPDADVADLKRRLLDLDSQFPALGLRVFTWTVDE
jgi:hypothetical protein